MTVWSPFGTNEYFKVQVAYQHELWKRIAAIHGKNDISYTGTILVG
jgi:hypothetical protein